jgi:phosphoglycolate phosphatase-like HAD superfamily hydrolase
VPRRLWLFDIDGTLLHAGGSGRAAFDAVMLAQHGVADGCRGLSFGGKTDPALVDELFVARLGRPASASERAAFLAAYLPELHARLSDVRLLPGVREALAYVAARGDVLGVATGNIRAGAVAKLAAVGLEGLLDGMIGGYGCDSHVRAELVAAAIRRAGTVDEVIIVGDTVHDISAARANGATVCAVATGSDPADKLGHADVVFASLVELPAWAEGR